jgi:photosystem II stability/assembly factor-like uncharacterized protein
MEAFLQRGLARALLVGLVAVVLCACSAAPIVAEPTATMALPATSAPAALAGAAISEQDAIAAALRYGTNGDGHIGPAQEPPRSTHAQLLLADKDRDQLVANGVSSNAADSLHGAVWLITLDGTWALNGPPPLSGTAAPVLEPLHHLVVVLDAGTGAVGFVSGKP